MLTPSASELRAALPYAASWDSDWTPDAGGDPPMWRVTMAYPEDTPEGHAAVESIFDGFFQHYYLSPDVQGYTNPNGEKSLEVGFATAEELQMFLVFLGEVIEQSSGAEAQYAYRARALLLRDLGFVLRGVLWDDERYGVALDEADRLKPIDGLAGEGQRPPTRLEYPPDASGWAVVVEYRERPELSAETVFFGADVYVGQAGLEMVHVADIQSAGHGGNALVIWREDFDRPEETEAQQQRVIRLAAERTQLHFPEFPEDYLDDLGETALVWLPVDAALMWEYGTLGPQAPPLNGLEGGVRARDLACREAFDRYRTYENQYEYLARAGDLTAEERSAKLRYRRLADQAYAALHECYRQHGLNGLEGGVGEGDALTQLYWDSQRGGSRQKLREQVRALAPAPTAAEIKKWNRDRGTDIMDVIDSYEARTGIKNIGGWVLQAGWQDSKGRLRP